MLHSTAPLDPANAVIGKFGGVSVVAELLGVPHSTVLRWTYPRERGGTGGLIPSKRQPQLLDKAQEQGIDLGPADFFRAAA